MCMMDCVSHLWNKGPESTQIIVPQASSQKEETIETTNGIYDTLAENRSFPQHAGLPMTDY